MESFVYIEPVEEGLDSTAKQILSHLSKISAVRRGPLRGICVGAHLEGKENLLRGLIDELIVVHVPRGYDSNTEAIANVLTEIVGEGGQRLLFLGHTYQGMELGPVIGWRLGIPVVANCIGFDWGEGEAICTRPLQGGKLQVTLRVSLDQGAIVSVQKGAWKEETPQEASDSLPVRRLAWKNSWAPQKTEVIGITEETLEGEEDITKAEILVSVGRGLGDPDNLPLVRELAEKLGGMISCSRPVVDLGWLPASRQVGISGRTVSPVIYLALGISGQSNHLAGINPSGAIIAVNKDAAAPIFNEAKYGIVDDILEFIPELLDQIKKKKVSEK
jgi:electron transfer flavoprotein alpha subunit